MRKIPIMVIIFMLVSIGFFSGCNSNKEEEGVYSIVGTWFQSDRPENIMIFKENGDLSITEGTNGTITGKYTLVNSTILSVNFDFGDMNVPPVSFGYNFESEDILTLKFSQEGTGDSSSQTYYRKNSI